MSTICTQCLNIDSVGCSLCEKYTVPIFNPTDPCSICLSNYIVKPIMIPIYINSCGHWLCLDCLIEYRKVSTVEIYPNIFGCHCPQCQTIMLAETIRTIEIYNGSQIFLCGFNGKNFTIIVDTEKVTGLDIKYIYAIKSDTQINPNFLRLIWNGKQIDDCLVSYYNDERVKFGSGSTIQILARLRGD